MNVTQLGWSLVHFLWQGASIATLYAAARHFVRRANGRYLLACAALASMIAARLRWRLTRPAPLEWCQTVERLRARLGLARAGAWRPLVLMPVGMLTGMPAAQPTAN